MPGSQSTAKCDMSFLNEAKGSALWQRDSHFLTLIFYSLSAPALAVDVLLFVEFSHKEILFITL